MKPELLAPCHDWTTLIAAVENGADAVYFGVKKYNMRMNAKNFSVKDMEKIAKYCHSNKVKCYLTTNIIIYENELKEVEELIKKAKKAKIDAIIVHDISVIELAKRYKIPFHISTQANVSNSKSANFYANLGASRVILARECNLEQIKEIVKKSKVGIELFVHGAMCVSVSGRCFFSQNFYGKSANRGECMQPCRQSWVVKGEKGEMIYNGERFLNAKDLCMIQDMDKLLKLGAVSFKIEGRMRDANYVSTVVKCYRGAIDNFSKKKVKTWMKELSSVFNRGFCTGFYYEVPNNEISFNADGNISKERKVLVGRVIKYYPKIQVAAIQMLSSYLKLGDTIIIEGQETYLKQAVSSMQIDKKAISKAVKGQDIAVKVEKQVKKGDEVYKIVNK